MKKCVICTLAIAILFFSVESFAWDKGPTLGDLRTVVKACDHYNRTKDASSFIDGAVDAKLCRQYRLTPPMYHFINGVMTAILAVARENPVLQPNGPPIGKVISGTGNICVPDEFNPNSDELVRFFMSYANKFVSESGLSDGPITVLAKGAYLSRFYCK